jgi:Zn-dependent M28 family amino/carboxypeptidase
LKTSNDWVAVSRRFQPDVKVEESELVVVGYGVDAPEYGWDDYKDVDVRGKTIVMLVNDPPVPDPQDASKLDPSVFKGKAMTYYGRWTYKFEIASKKGAAAALLIHETDPAGYPYSVVQGSWGRENFDIAGGDPSKRVAVEAWISLETAKKIFDAAGQDFNKLKAAAIRRDFRPVALHGKATLEVKADLRKVASKNVVGLLPGSDPAVKDQTIVYTAHWDHLGRDPKLTGDQIYNGAADNASGVASILEIARGFARVQPPPRRSILFLIVTAEEKGLLGAKHYADHPLYPIEKTIANINMDVTNLWGRTTDVTNVGQGMNTLDDVLEEVCKAAGKTVKPDAEPEKGFYYRSDHFEFARVGVPALDPKGGTDFIGKPADFAQKTREDYTKNHYHKVSDEVRKDWDLAGAAEDAGLMFKVGYRVSQGDTLPEWKAGTEFKAVRDASKSARTRSK